MTEPPKKLEDRTETTLRRRDHGTEVRETLWPHSRSGMRSLNVSYNDGTHMISLITHDHREDRLTTIGLHLSESVSIRSDDSLATTLEVQSSDGTTAFVSLFGITLEQIADAVATAIAQKHSREEETIS